MKVPDKRLFTPIYVKSHADMPWPAEEKAFYLLTGSGLFFCRNHPFFQSCVPARDWPSELPPHKASVALNYPKVSRRLFERVVGFFDRIGQMYGAEAAVLLAWDTVAQRVQLIVPEQLATVGRSSWSGKVYPIGLHYETPANLPANLVVFGDVHSHVDEAAYASGTDKYDERYRAGLHIVVGRLSTEPPELHIEAVVDGVRFPVEPEQVLAGYRRRCPRVPQAWIDRVKVEPTWKQEPYSPVTYPHQGPANHNYFTGPGTGYSNQYQRQAEPAKHDEAASETSPGG